MFKKKNSLCLALVFLESSVKKLSDTKLLELKNILSIKLSPNNN